MTGIRTMFASAALRVAILAAPAASKQALRDALVILGRGGPGPPA